MEHTKNNTILYSVIQIINEPLSHYYNWDYIDKTVEATKKLLIMHDFNIGPVSLSFN